MSSWHSYPKIYSIGHGALTGFFDRPVYVEEKVDGSQFSFGRFGDRVRCRSKGAELIVESPPDMFRSAVQGVLERKDLLLDGVTYRGECLARPKHNSLAYERAPIGNVILFDVNTGEESYGDRSMLEGEATRLGYETVPVLYEGMISSPDQLRVHLDRVSVLGGQKIEGVVCKQATVTMFGEDKKALIAKFVSEAFKEVHSREWRDSNPNKGDVLKELCEAYRTQARWQKALQRLRERGECKDSPTDIGLLIKLVAPDIEEECKAEIMERLWKWAWPHISRKAVHGLPEWYKSLLLAKQFEKP